MSTLALTHSRPLLALAPWRLASAEPGPARRIAFASAARRLLTVGGALWAMLCGLLFGTAAVCVAGVVCGGLAIWLIVRGVWTTCLAIAAGGATGAGAITQPTIGV